MARVKIRGLEVSANENGSDDGDADDTDEHLGQVQIRILSVTQDEATTGTSHSDVGPDALIQSTLPNGEERIKDLLLLRKEHAKNTDGRIYEVEFQATNSLSNTSCTGKVQVCVPTKKGKGAQCVNSGQNYNSEE